MVTNLRCCRQRPCKAWGHALLACELSWDAGAAVELVHYQFGLVRCVVLGHAVPLHTCKSCLAIGSNSRGLGQQPGRVLLGRAGTFALHTLQMSLSFAHLIQGAAAVLRKCISPTATGGLYFSAHTATALCNEAWGRGACSSCCKIEYCTGSDDCVTLQ